MAVGAGSKSKSGGRDIGLSRDVHEGEDLAEEDLLVVGLNLLAVLEEKARHDSGGELGIGDGPSPGQQGIAILPQELGDGVRERSLHAIGSVRVTTQISEVSGERT